MSSVITTANNAFTYTTTTTSSDVYIANSSDDQTVFDILSAYNYYIKTDANKHMTTVNPKEYHFAYKNVDIPANTPTTVNTCTLSESTQVAIITLMVPIQVDNFVDITSSDKMTVTIKVDDTIVQSVEVILNPVTMVNNVYFIKNVSASTITINVTSTLSAKYIQGLYNFNDVPFNSINANSIICF